jgi:hypothetical protein
MAHGTHKISTMWDMYMIRGAWGNGHLGPPPLGASTAIDLNFAAVSETCTLSLTSLQVTLATPLHSVFVGYRIRRHLSCPSLESFQHGAQSWYCAIVTRALSFHVNVQPWPFISAFSIHIPPHTSTGTQQPGVDALNACLPYDWKLIRYGMFLTK